MAHARPTIATDAAGPREIVRDGIDGRLVPRGDPQALATAIAELLDCPERRSALAAAGLASVRARFALPVVARQISALVALWPAAARSPLASRNRRNPL